MICPQCRKRPLSLSGRTDACALCRYLKRCENAVASRIERTFKLEQQRRMLARKVAA